MQYQISYYSPNGHAEILVNAFCQMLPRDTHVSNLEEEMTPCADIQLVGFDIGGSNLDAIPFKVMEYLEQLEGKTILLFATVPFAPNDYVRSRVDHAVMPFLPDECDYLGLYLCSAQPPATLIAELKNVISHHPENGRAKHWLEQCEKAVGHPDRSDVQKACQFARHALRLDN